MEGCAACLTNVRNNPRALIALKLFSLGSGIFLFVAGLLGCISLFTQPFLIVVSAYAIIFGFMVIGARLHKPALGRREHSRRPLSVWHPGGAAVVRLVAYPLGCARPACARALCAQ